MREVHLRNAHLHFLVPDVAGPSSIADIMRSQGINPDGMQLPRVQLKEFSKTGHVPLHEVSILRTLPCWMLIFAIHACVHVSERARVHVSGERKEEREHV